MPVDEQDVAGEHDAIFRDIGEHVATRVRGTDLNQPHGLVADPPFELTLEGNGRRGHVSDTFEVELTEDFGHERSHLGAGIIAAFHFSQPARVAQIVTHLLGARARSDNFRSFHQPVAEGVIAVGMGVDHGADSRRRGLRPAHRVQHLLRQRQVKQSVDQQRLAAVANQARIAPAPRAVGLKVGVGTIAQIMQALGVSPFAHDFRHGDFLLQREFRPDLIIDDPAAVRKGSSRLQPNRGMVRPLACGQRGL